MFLCTVHLRRPSYLSLLFSGTLHSVGYIFPFLPCFCFPSFLSYLQSHLRQPLCLHAFLFLWDGFGNFLLYNVTNLHPEFFRPLSPKSRTGSTLTHSITQSTHNNSYKRSIIITPIFQRQNLIMMRHRA